MSSTDNHEQMTYYIEKKKMKMVVCFLKLSFKIESIKICNWIVINGKERTI